MGKLAKPIRPIHQLDVPLNSNLFVIFNIFHLHRLLKTFRLDGDSCHVF